MQAEMGDQRFDVMRQHVDRIGGGVVRGGAEPMRTEIRHDDAKAGAGDFGRSAIAPPVHLARAEQAVEEDDRAAVPQFVPADAHTIEGQEIIAGHDIGHRISSAGSRSSA